jgi:hypothetical protein
VKGVATGREQCPLLKISSPTARKHRAERPALLSLKWAALQLAATNLQRQISHSVVAVLVPSALVLVLVVLEVVAAERIE